MRFLTPADLRALDRRAYDGLLARQDMLVAAGDGVIDGLAAAALLTADYAVLDRNATLDLRDAPPAAIAWRLCSGAAWPPLSPEGLEGGGPAAAVHTAAAAVELGLCDEVIEGDPQVWLERWLAGRSVLALETAAILIRSHGGDALEREEFSRLFSLGEPQKGLRAFLEKRRPRFRDFPGTL
jgi:enoyl-CoA hydratase/carnithine racemase